ncbi:MAG: nitrous oxide reductase accessory protein NosL [Rhizobiales bacterium]|nr:nitrous oxide reductase accessory protein NosL [Hyphomicrobiales bacterium]
MKQTEGPEKVHYGRESCTMCGMIISDPLYAAEIRGAADQKLVKFDDVGCAIHWLRHVKWDDGAIAEFWVMDSGDGTTWLDARKARYLAGAVTPMDYGHAALDDQRPDLIDFEKMRSTVLSMGLSSRCPPPAESNA